MRTFILIALSLVITTSCSTRKSATKEIDQEAKDSTVTNSAALGGTITDLIANSKTLTDAQKKELTQIIDGNKKKAQDLTEQSFKYRAVLIQELLADKATPARIRIIEKDIEKIEKLRLQNTFETVRKISAVVCKHPDNQQFAEHLINIDGKGSASH